MTASDQSLKRFWYQRIKDECGFKDIERESGRLIEEKHPRTVRQAFRSKEQRESYYAACANFLFTFDFPDELSRKLWELHADGLSLSQIAKELGMKKSTVHVLIKRLRLLAGIA